MLHLQLQNFITDYGSLLASNDPSLLASFEGILEKVAKLRDKLGGVKP